MLKYRKLLIKKKINVCNSKINIQYELYNKYYFTNEGI